MATTTPNLDVKSLNAPDETRPFKANGRLEIVTVGGLVVGRGTFEPGWALVRTRQADCPDRLLPSSPRGLCRIWADACQDGRRHRERGRAW